jgi:hypothetical protein
MSSNAKKTSTKPMFAKKAASKKLTVKTGIKAGAEQRNKLVA